MANLKANSSEVRVADSSLRNADAKESNTLNKSLSKQLEQELKSLGGMGEDLADILSNNWRNLIVLLALGIAAIVLFHGFGEVRQQNREETARQFQDAQSSFASLEEVVNKRLQAAQTKSDPVSPVSSDGTNSELAKPESEKAAAQDTSASNIEEKKDDASEKAAAEEKDKAADEHNERAAEGFKETIAVLANSQGSSGYGLLANLYKAESQIAEQQYTDARNLLDTIFGVKAFIAAGERVNDTLSAEGVSLDLALLLYSRSLITEASKSAGSPAEGQSFAEGIAAATALAERGLFANVEALVLLSRLGDDLYSQEQLQTLAKKVVADHPEMRPQVEKDLPQLKL